MAKVYNTSTRNYISPKSPLGRSILKRMTSPSEQDIQFSPIKSFKNLIEDYGSLSRIDSILSLFESKYKNFCYPKLDGSNTKDVYFYWNSNKKLLVTPLKFEECLSQNKRFIAI